MNIIKIKESTNLSECKLPYDVQKIEQEPIITTNQSHEYDDYESENFDFASEYLYHGIRFQQRLEKLENIFKEGKILAGKYLPNYHFYIDNCNHGQYVSLLKYTSETNLEYETFILENISLLVTPLCNAQETKYVDFQTWQQIQEEQYQLKHIYSYMRGECLCKDFIPIDMIKAIGVPYRKLRLQGKEAYAIQLIEDIKKLMEKYNVCLPIVDTSCYNSIIYETDTQRYVKKRKLII